MLRSFLIYMSRADWARQTITRWDFAWKAASRFVAGETLDQAIEAVRVLNGRGINVTLDHLGEHVTTADEARKATDDICKMADAIATSGARANISIKLTQIGLALDEQLCLENLRDLLGYARGRGIFVRIDMEDSPVVDTTLSIYRRMRDDYGMDNTGVVIQAYLYRSAKDIEQAAKEGVRVRLCKGAYKEPAEVAFPRKADTDANYDLLARMLIDGAIVAGAPRVSADGRVPPIPAIASHDPIRVANAKAYAASVGLPRDAIEFQMLYGIRRDLQDQLAKEMYPVRVYVPYGTQWYPYFVRRLAERPANVWFFVSNFFRR
jgi:proline dehydrogenase